MKSSKRIVVIHKAKVVSWLANGQTEIGGKLRHEIWKTKRFLGKEIVEANDLNQFQGNIQRIVAVDVDQS